MRDAIRHWPSLTALAGFAAHRHGYGNTDGGFGVTYPGDEVPYPTSVALVLQWMTEHFKEHVPHVRELFAEWQKAR